MSEHLNSDFTFDLSAASWRSSFKDQSLMVNSLAARFIKALPNIVEVAYSFHIFREKRNVRSIKIHLDSNSFNLDFTKRSGMQCQIAKVGRGVAISSKEIDFTNWLDELSKGLNSYVSINKNSAERVSAFLL